MKTDDGEFEFQRLASGSVRKQVADPLGDKPISITRKTVAALMAEVEVYRRLREDLKNGLLTRDDVKRRLATRGRGGVAVTVKDVWERYRAACDTRRRDALAHHWDAHFAPHFDGIDAEDLDAARWTAWQNWEDERTTGKGKGKRKGAARTSIKTYFGLLRAAYQAAIDERFISGPLPWGKWKLSNKHGRPAVERATLRSMQEIEVLLSTARDYDEERRRAGHYSDACVRVGTAFLGGYRQGELGGLRWDCLRPGENGETVAVVAFQVRRSWRTEHPDWTKPIDTPKWATAVKPVLLHPDLARLLEDHRTYHRSIGIYQPDGPVFPTMAGEFRGDPRTIRAELLRRLLVRSGLEVDLARFTPHCARHSFATLEAAHSTNLKDTAERTRHASPLSLMTYLHKSGRGLAPPALPAMSVTSPSAVQVLPARVEAVELRHVFEEDPEAPDQAVEPAQVEAVPVGLFAQAFEKWNAGGRKGPRPLEVTKAAERARAAAYKTATRLGGNLDQRRRAGRYAKRGLLGAWVQWLNRRDGKAAEPAAPIARAALPPGVIPFVSKPSVKSRSL